MVSCFYASSFYWLLLEGDYVGYHLMLIGFAF